MEVVYVVAEIEMCDRQTFATHRVHAKKIHKIQETKFLSEISAIELPSTYHKVKCFYHRK